MLGIYVTLQVGCLKWNDEIFGETLLLIRPKFRWQEVRRGIEKLGIDLWRWGMWLKI